MAYNTEYKIPLSKTPCTKDIYITNIPTTSRNVSGETVRYERIETEQALNKHLRLLFLESGINYSEIVRVNIPASMSQHCRTYIAFMRLENPREHAEVIEKFTDRKFRGYHLLLSWSNSDPMIANPIRYFRVSREDAGDEETSQDTIVSLKAQKQSIEQAIEFEQSKENKQQQKQESDKHSQDNERRRSLLITLQSLENQRQKKQNEQDRQAINKNETIKTFLNLKIQKLFASSF